MMSWRHRVLALACAAALAAAEWSQGGQLAVLDLQSGGFRAFVRWKTPSLAGQDGTPKPLLEPKRREVKDEERRPVPVADSGPPPADWAAPAFDDSAWPRARGPVALRPWFGASIHTPGNPAEWNLVCLRGKFRVEDPQKAGELTLDAVYHGGLLVRLNGKEVHRSHLPPGELAPDTPAEAYPDEAYLRPDGRRYGEGDDKAFAERMQCRTRSAQGVRIPAALLRKGLNVLALEVHAAPIREIAVTAPEGQVTWRGTLTPWPHAGVLEVKLAAGSDAGIVPNAAPPQVIELWNCGAAETVQAWDFADPSEQVQPIRLVGARNGTFSGKVALGSAGAIRNLRAAAGELAREGGGAAIPASAVLVRWAEPARPDYSWNRPERFDRLSAQFPAELAPAAIRVREAKVQPAPAAVAPVWVTVKVPRDAAPGAYRGALAIEAEGSAGKAAFSVPIHLEVHGWTLPDPKDFVTHHNLYQSPETVALYYKVPLWSEKHWELVGRSLELLHQVGNKICVLNLVVKSANMGNNESMVRWVRRPDGGYGYDFTVAERYLDLYTQKAGKPAIVCLNIWGYFRKEDKAPKPPQSVSLLDPATGKLELLPQPPYGTPENEAFWKPVLLELRKRLEQRGLFDVTAVCYASYCWAPTKEVVDVYRSIWPDGKWMNASHSNPTSFDKMPCPYSEWVWGCGSLYCPDRDKGKGFPRAWKRGTERIELGNPRVGVGFVNVFRDYSPLASYRTITEAAMQGGLRGIGRVGGDFWPLPIGTDGRLAPMCDSQFAIGPVNSTVSLTSPGPDGAAFNERLEMFREGVQIAEAIIFLQRALEAKSLEPALAARVEQLLDERARHYLRTLPGQQAGWWAFESSGWQARDARLFALAAEAARAPRPAP